MLDRKKDFVLFRHPHETQATRYTQADVGAQELAQYEALNTAEGFVFAPFTPSKACPILLIRPDEVEKIPIPRVRLLDAPFSIVHSPLSSLNYSRDFRLFHRQLETGVFDKIVLSRVEEIRVEGCLDVEKLFMKACQVYPRMFVALVSTQRSGTWLMATPETLLARHGNQWQTMALAGTMKQSAPSAPQEGEDRAKNVQKANWSQKNRQEQQLVARYLEAQLQGLASEIDETAPYTQQAGDLLHLRSDFTFRLKPQCGLGDIVRSLHPTPAVCGLPKAEAWAFINANESAPRRYYSGFAGPVSRTSDIRLYVSLRCMELFDGGLRLYAGGGLLKDSTEEQEWEETKAKMETMKRLLQEERKT